MGRKEIEASASHAEERKAQCKYDPSELMHGEPEDTNRPIQRGMGAWSEIKRRLKHSRLTKSNQARVMEAIVDSTMLNNCQTRARFTSEINRYATESEVAMLCMEHRNETLPPQRDERETRKSLERPKRTRNQGK